MQIQLLSGDHDWSESGYHICDKNGFAIILSESKLLDVSDEISERILPIIEESRVFRGLNRDGSIYVPPSEEPL